MELQIDLNGELESIGKEAAMTYMKVLFGVRKFILKPFQRED
jgi:hypothetical protein